MAAPGRRSRTRSRSARAGRERLDAHAHGDARDRSRRGRAGGGRPLLPRGGGAGRALDQPSRRDRRGDADRGRASAPRPRPRRAPVPPERRRVAAEHAGLLDPGDDPRLRRGAAELGRRGVHRPARARATRSRRRSSTRSGQGRGVETPDGRPAVLLDTTRIPEEDAEVSLPYMLRRYRSAGIDPLPRRS